MNAFDKVIGYQEIKNDLMQVCSMYREPEHYEKFGARAPRGILLYGNPGLGKTLLAKCIIEEIGIKNFIIRKDCSKSSFINKITATFKQAVESEPSIVFLDDLDKFANEDDKHIDAEEYVAVQSGIDSIGEHSVLVIATANNRHKLPNSLIRPGRIDRTIKVKAPVDDEAEKIIKYYLKNKRISDDVDMDDVVKMIQYTSCADLEKIVNEAAVHAVFLGRQNICIDDLLQTVLHFSYDVPKNRLILPDSCRRKAAYHEAGHVIVSEILEPGSVGLASIYTNSDNEQGGFVHRWKRIEDWEADVLISLSGIAAVELYEPENKSGGSSDDLRHAYTILHKRVTMEARCGLGLLAPYVNDYCTSDSLNERIETAVQIELERELSKVRDILVRSKLFLERIVDELMNRNALMYSDIQLIKRSCMEINENTEMPNDPMTK